MSGLAVVGVGAVRERQVSSITPAHWLWDWIDNGASTETV